MNPSGSSHTEWKDDDKYGPQASKDGVRDSRQPLSPLRGNRPLPARKQEERTMRKDSGSTTTRTTKRKSTEPMGYTSNPDDVSQIRRAKTLVEEARHGDQLPFNPVGNKLQGRDQTDKEGREVIDLTGAGNDEASNGEEEMDVDPPMTNRQRQAEQQEADDDEEEEEPDESRLTTAMQVQARMPVQAARSKLVDAEAAGLLSKLKKKVQEWNTEQPHGEHRVPVPSLASVRDALIKPVPHSDVATRAVKDGLAEGLEELRHQFEGEILWSTPAAGTGDGGGALVLGYVVPDQENLTEMVDHSEAHIAPALGRVMGEAARVKEQDLPRHRGGSIDFTTLVDRSPSVAVDSERITDLLDRVKGSDGRCKKARPSRQMKEASALSVAATLRKASAVVGVGGVVTTIGGIAYHHMEQQGLMGEAATLTDDAGRVLPTVAKRSEALAQYITDITGLEYQPNLKGASCWIVMAAVPGDRSVAAMPAGGLLALFVLPGNHFTWAVHLLIHGPGKGGIGLGVQALQSCVDTQHYQLASAMGALTRGLEVRDMKASPLYADCQALTLSELGARGAGCKGYEVNAGKKARKLAADLGLDLPEAETVLPHSFVKSLIKSGAISKAQRKVLFTSVHCQAAADAAQYKMGLEALAQQTPEAQEQINSLDAPARRERIKALAQSKNGSTSSNLGKTRGGQRMAPDVVFVTYRDLAGTTVGWLTTTNGSGKGYRPSSTDGDLQDKLGYLQSRFVKGQNMKATAAMRLGLITDVDAEYATEAAEVYLKNRGKSLKWVIQKPGSDEVDKGPIEWEGEREWVPRFGDYAAPAKPT